MIFIILGIQDPPLKCFSINNTATTADILCLPGFSGGVSSGLQYQIWLNGPFIERKQHDASEISQESMVRDRLLKGLNRNLSL